MPRKNNKLTEYEIATLCQQITMIVKAGLPTYYGISILYEEEKDTCKKELLGQIYKPMEHGASLYEAISQTNAFPHYMVYMLHIG